MSFHRDSTESPRTTNPDPAATEILFRRYWSSTGWIKGTISSDEFEYAKQAGVMFEAVEITHDVVLSRAFEIRDRISAETIGNSFLASLSSRRMDWRSPLGSFSAILHLPSHSFAPRGDSRTCAVCGAYSKLSKVDISVLNFERLKWGGVRHKEPHYAVLDLEWFCAMPCPKPVDNDLAILRNIVKNVSELADSARPGSIEKAIKSLLASNSSERRILIDILGLAGVLTPRGLPTFWKEYPLFAERKQPSGKNDWGYPVLWWVGSDGINLDALKTWFPKL